MGCIFQGIQCFDFNFTKIIQNIEKKDDWHQDKLQENIPFYYLVEWYDQSRCRYVLKFGYKNNLNAFRRNYGKPHCILPNRSIIWLLTNYKRNEDRYFSIIRTIFSVEQDILNQLKKDNLVKCLKNTKEYFHEYDIDICIKTIERSISPLNFTKSFNEQLKREDIKHKQFTSKII